MFKRDRALTGSFGATTKIPAELSEQLVFQEEHQFPTERPPKINKVIPYKMNGPNPAKISSCSFNFMPKILHFSALTIWQGAGNSLQNGL